MLVAVRSAASAQIETQAVRALHVLWACPYLPSPSLGGNAVRVFELLRHLQRRGHRICLLVQSDTALEPGAIAQVRAHVDRLIIVPAHPRRGSRTRHSSEPASLPEEVSVRGLANSARAQMRALLRLRWDAVHVEHSYFLAPFLKELAAQGQPFILTEYLRDSQRERHNEATSRIARVFGPLWHWRRRAFARAARQRPTRLIAISDADAASLAKLTGRAIDLIPNGTGCESYAGIKPDPHSTRILCVADFANPSNQQALKWIVTDILPRIWTTVPEARFAVCGAGIEANWSRQWSDERIEWRGLIPDIRDVQRQSAVFLAAVASGAAVKLELLEAMAAGLPVVTTRAGAHALCATQTEPVSVGDDAEQLASAVESLLQDAALNRRCGEAGRSFARDCHDWPTMAAKMEAILLQIESR